MIKTTKICDMKTENDQLQMQLREQLVYDGENSNSKNTIKVMKTPLSYSMESILLFGVQCTYG